MEPRKMTPIPPEMLRTVTKPAVKSKTVWGVLVTILGGLLAALGIEANPDFLKDGIQIGQDLLPLVGFAMAIVGYVLKELGHRTASALISGVFRPQD